MHNRISKTKINITQMMVGKQWVKRWGTYRWAGKASRWRKQAAM